MGEKAMVLAIFLRGGFTGILLAALLTPPAASADCTKIVDKHLEYYDGIKDHFANRTTFDPGIKKIPYDVKIIDNNAQQYLLLSRNISFYYPNTASLDADFGFQNGYIQAMCIILTLDGLKWVVWQDDVRVWFYPEFESPNQ